MFPWILIPHPIFFFFFFNDTATTEIYTLSLHDALPIYRDLVAADGAQLGGAERQQVPPLEFDQAAREDVPRRLRDRSEEHTSELQSRLHLVCRLLLEKKKKKPAPTNRRPETGPQTTNQL